MSVLEDKVTVKGLNSQIGKLEGEVNTLNSEISAKKKEASSKCRTIREVRKKVKDLGVSSNPTVTEHAMLRYFERVLNFDLKEIEKKILTDSVLNQAKVVGGSGLFPAQGFKVRMKDFTVVTLVD